jgi:hypothetical protein
VSYPAELSSVLLGLQVDLAGAPIASVMPPGNYRGLVLVRDRASGSVYLRGTNGVAPAWVPIAGSAAVLPVVQSFVGAGPHVVADDADVVTVDPAGAATSLVLPALAARAPGRPLRVLQVGASGGTVAFSSASPLRLLTPTFTLGHSGDALDVLPVAGAWRLVGLVGAPVAFEVYVGPGGADDADGSLATPLATLAEALTRAQAVGWRTTGRVRLLPNGSAYSFGTRVAPPASWAPGASPLRIVGEQTQVAAGTFASFTNGNALTGDPASFTTAGAPFVANALRGCVLEVTTGAAAGLRLGLFENGVSSGASMTHNAVATAPAPGDAFVVWRSPAITDASTTVQGGPSAELELEKIEWNPSLIVALNVQLGLQEVFLRTFGGFFENGSSVQSLNAQAAYSLLLASPFDGFAVAVGLGLTNLTRAGLRWVGGQVFGRNAASFSELSLSEARLTVETTADVRRVRSYGATLNPGVALLLCRGGRAQLSAARLDNTLVAEAIHAAEGATVVMDRVSGTGNIAGCVRASGASCIAVPDAGTTTTIDGAGTPYRVGANPPTTAAAIAGGLAANTTDLAAASSQLCRIGAPL